MGQILVIGVVFADRPTLEVKIERNRSLLHFIRQPEPLHGVKE